MKAGTFKSKDDPVQIETDGVKIAASQVLYYHGPLKAIDERLNEIKALIVNNRLESKDDNAAMISKSKHDIIGAVSETQAELTTIIKQEFRDLEGLAENRFRDLGTIVKDVGTKVDANNGHLIELKARRRS